VTGVDVWPYRVRGGEVEFLLLHRSGINGPPFWQGVSGWIEADELPHVAALRELKEETGFAADALFSVDAIFDIYKWHRGTIDTTVPFAAMVPAGADPVLSEEHDAWRWVSGAEALDLLPYEPQRAAVRRIAADLLSRPESADLWRIPG
jgi:dihydroneopterin triphosphate diphosphatase